MRHAEFGNLRDIDPLVGSLISQLEIRPIGQNNQRIPLELDVCKKEVIDHFNMDNAYEDVNAEFLCIKDASTVTLQGLQQVKEDRKAIEFVFTKCDDSKLEDGQVCFDET